MSRFVNSETGIIVSVDDSKDARFGTGWVSADAQPEPKRAPRKKSE